MPDKNDDAAAGVRVIRTKNARSGMIAIKSQSRVSTDPERGRRGWNTGYS